MAATFHPKMLIRSTSDPRSTIGEEIKNEKVTPNGSPALVNPINNGMDEQEQNGVYTYGRNEKCPTEMLKKALGWKPAWSEY